ncbi:MAG: RNA polymerase subunit sigma, partial [Armatimonadetes bacterium]|nr:RNA polymerase subunit sigma [Armatimonadota bacterium]
ADIEELSYQEIAEALGCPMGTVRSRLNRGRRLLQKVLWDYMEAR